MYARVYSGAVAGVDAYCIEVEVDCGGGMGQIHIVGLPDASVKESQERVRAAIKACEFLMPPGKKWIVNLAPADTRKEGPAFDLPIAVGVLAATGYIPAEKLASTWMIGELGLDGSVRGTTGVLPVAMSCKAAGCRRLIIPDANISEAELIEGLEIYPVSHLKQVVTILGGNSSSGSVASNARGLFERMRRTIKPVLDYADVKGQKHAKRALMIAAAGRHNVLMVGPPGSGKSMLAQRLPGIMPGLDFDEALELTKLYSVAGLLSPKSSIATERPFRSPHHSASVSGLIGGGTWPRPGEISLSHKGVLFLDELTEFPRHHIDAMRQPLESGTVTISRANQTLSYPASFLLVGACNPCPCGYRGDPVQHCNCTPHQADRYWSRLSGPFLDRIDLQVEVSRLNEVELSSSGGEQSSEDIRLQVDRAVDRQRDRSPDSDTFLYNAHLGQRELKRFCKLDEKCKEILVKAITQLGLSARAHDRIIRIARTISDLDDGGDIRPAHIAEAVRYRTPCNGGR
jgi:magnesium chelatase family protein